LPRRKVTFDTLRRMRELREKGLTYREMGRKLGVSKANGGRKSRFYIHEREVAKKVVERIQQELKSSCG
jgi:DNA invertase Pin-like site-specific DNA recombinase